MRSRWIGWSLVVCAAATAAYAEASRRTSAHGRVARLEVKLPAPAATPPVMERAGAAAKERSRPTPRQRPEAAPGDLARLADDPALARADRIDGRGVKGMVAFTFDDGPNSETTPHVIEALEKYDVPATFFIVTRRLVGRLAAQNRTLLAREIAGGFLVASHSVSHTDLRTVSTKAIGREIDQSLRVLSKQAGHPIGLFRAPFGAIDDRGHELLKKRGLTEVKWSIDTIDWRERDGERLRQRTLAAILRQEGGVVLMHDAKEVTAKSLGLLLDDLEAANCQRLAAGNEPILPVSLHYWLRDHGKPRPVPEEVRQRTLAYRTALPDRCAARDRPAAAETLAKQHAKPPARVAKAGRAKRARRPAP